MRATEYWRVLRLSSSLATQFLLMWALLRRPSSCVVFSHKNYCDVFVIGNSLKYISIQIECGISIAKKKLKKKISRKILNFFSIFFSFFAEILLRCFCYRHFIEIYISPHWIRNLDFQKKIEKKNFTENFELFFDFFFIFWPWNFIICCENLRSRSAREYNSCFGNLFLRFFFHVFVQIFSMNTRSVHIMLRDLLTQKSSHF
jgi:hypothetical protein